MRSSPVALAARRAKLPMSSTLAPPAIVLAPRLRSTFTGGGLAECWKARKFRYELQPRLADRAWRFGPG